MDSILDSVKNFIADVSTMAQDDYPMSVRELKELGHTPLTQSSSDWVRLHHELIKDHVYNRARRGLHTMNFPLVVYKEKPGTYTKKGLCHIDDVTSIMQLLKKKFPGTKIWTDTYSDSETSESPTWNVVINMDWSGE